MSQIKKDRNQKLVELRKRGLSYGDIASLFNISRQRVHQVTSSYQDILTPLSYRGNSQNLYLLVRKAIFERDKNACQRCGNTEHLLIHHLDKNDKNQELNNLILLCSTCHLNLHRPPNGKPLSKQRVHQILRDAGVLENLPESPQDSKRGLLKRLYDVLVKRK